MFQSIQVAFQSKPFLNVQGNPFQIFQNPILKSNQVASFRIGPFPIFQSIQVAFQSNPFQIFRNNPFRIVQSVPIFQSIQIPFQIVQNVPIFQSDPYPLY